VTCIDTLCPQSRSQPQTFLCKEVTSAIPEISGVRGGRIDQIIGFTLSLRRLMLMESCFLNNRDLNIPCGPVTVDLIHISIFTIQRLVKSLTILNNFSAFREDKRLVFRLGLPELLKFFVCSFRP